MLHLVCVVDHAGKDLVCWQMQMQYSPCRKCAASPVSVESIQDLVSVHLALRDEVCVPWLLRPVFLLSAVDIDSLVWPTQASKLKPSES